GGRWVSAVRHRGGVRPGPIYLSGLRRGRGRRRGDHHEDAAQPPGGEGPLRHSGGWYWHLPPGLRGGWAVRRGTSVGIARVALPAGGARWRGHGHPPIPVLRVW